jgi:predicted NBD/HSP70 family sugar kinase
VREERADVVAKPAIGPSLLGKMNERQVLRVVQTRGPVSRADVVRYSGISAPTVSKATAALLRAGLLEEIDAPEAARGRPAKKLRLATERAQVLGVVIDAGECRVVAAGLDGRLRDETVLTIATPESYDPLIKALARAAAVLVRERDATLGIGISMPGLIDHRQRKGVLSPNVPATDGRSPERDLGRRLGIECVMLQESHGLCLAEREYGEARGLDDFAMLDISTGVGLGVMSGGRLLTGHRGLAGEVGHITVVADGPVCACGNRGCLETLAGDSALARAVSSRLRRTVSVDAVVNLVRAGRLDASPELEQTGRYLAIGMAAVINLFNPATLFVHGRFLEADDGLFTRIVDQVRGRALAPSFADCRIVRARGSKRQGAVAGIIQHLTRAIAPTLDSL